jgi:hypothetical protein
LVVNRFMGTLNYLGRLVAAVLGAGCVLLALAVPIGLISVCYEGGCTDARQEHWLRNLLALGFMGFALCLTSVIGAALFVYARHGKLRTSGRGESPE